MTERKKRQRKEMGLSRDGAVGAWPEVRFRRRNTKLRLVDKGHSCPFNAAAIRHKFIHTQNAHFLTTLYFTDSPLLLAFPLSSLNLSIHKHS